LRHHSHCHQSVLFFRPPFLLPDLPRKGADINDKLFHSVGGGGMEDSVNKIHKDDDSSSDGAASSSTLACVHQNEDRVLWKLGTLPPWLITFCGLTHSLEKSWHVLGLGHNPSVDKAEIDCAAVVHYNGNMKPWLELATTNYRRWWLFYTQKLWC
ncbi:Polygalacturonate 4-alpha-galacturonosyltransferase, partial [Linum grandiflorum]